MDKAKLALVCLINIMILNCLTFPFSSSASLVQNESNFAVLNHSLSQSTVNPPHLDVLDVRDLPYVQRLCALTLQGVVNANATTNFIYLLESHFEYDEQWLTYYQTNLSASVKYFTFQNLLAEYKNSINGYVLYDPSVPASQFLAATICGLNGNIAVTPDLLSTVESLGIPMDMNLTGMFTAMSPTAIYQWGYNNLFPFCSHTIIGNMIYNNADDGYYDIYQQIVDYLVANKAFIMGLSSSTEPDHTLKQQFLTSMNHGAYVFGWCGPNDYESTHVTQVTRAGLTEVGSFPESPNFSVHSKIIPDGQAQTYTQKTQLDTNLVYNSSKTYVTFIFSDGDGLWTANMRFRNNWDSTLRGQIKLGWEVGPDFTTLCPDILTYYYSTETVNDEFVGGCGGMGYFYPDQTTQADLITRLTLANKSMTDMDLNALYMMQHIEPPSNITLETYSRTLRGATFFDGYQYENSPAVFLNGSVWFETSFPVMPVEWGAENVTTLTAEIEDIGLTNQFIVIHVMPIENVIDTVYAITTSLNSTYQVVLPSELASLKAQDIKQQLMHPSSIPTIISTAKTLTPTSSLGFNLSGSKLPTEPLKTLPVFLLLDIITVVVIAIVTPIAIKRIKFVRKAA